MTNSAIRGPGRRVAVVLAILPSLILPATAGTLDEVRQRDRLVCGVSEGLPGFSQKDDDGAWTGFDVDFCRAVAAAALADPDKVDYVPLSADERFAALQDGSIDLLSRNSTWNLTRDVGLGLDFPGISYFDGQGFLIQALYGMTSAFELQGARICVVRGTTSQENAEAFFASEQISVTYVPFAGRDGAREAYAASECDAYTADRSALAAERSLLTTPDDHVILRDVISKEPLGPVVREDDPRWADVVRWTLFGLITAEEVEITSDSALAGDRSRAIRLAAPAATSLGLGSDWLVRVVAAVGNYGEIFNRNLGEETPLALRRGYNALWTRGGLLYAPPMR